MDFDEWIRDVEKFCESHIFPLMSRVSSLHKMKLFLDMGVYTASAEWSNMTLIDYYRLKAYTQFVLKEYDKMQTTIENGIRAIDEWNPVERIASQWKNDFEILNEKKELSNEEKNEWLNDTVSNTLNIWLGKNWETVIKNRLFLPFDFNDCANQEEVDLVQTKINDRYTKQKQPVLKRIFDKLFRKGQV